MSTSYLQLATVDGVVVASFTGQPNCPSVDLADVFHQILAEVGDMSPPQVVIDLSGISYFDSSSLGEIARLHQRVANSGGRLALCHLSETFLELFKVIKFDKLFDIYSDRTQAIEAVSSRTES